MEHGPSPRTLLLRLLRDVSLIDVGIFLLVTVACWLLGWRTWFEYGRSLIVGGILALLVGVMTLAGRGASVADPQNAYVDRMGYSSMYEYHKQALINAYEQWQFLVVMALASLVPMLAGATIMRVVLRSLT